MLDLQRKNYVAFGQHPLDRLFGLGVNVGHLCNTLVMGVIFSKIWSDLLSVFSGEGPNFLPYFVDIGGYPPRIRPPPLFSGGTLMLNCQVKSFRV